MPYSVLPPLPRHSPLGKVMEQPLILGLFLPIHNGGWTMSAYPRATHWTFEYNAALTRQAEALGFDLVFGPAHWLSKGGFGGEMHYRETALDTLMAAAGLAAVTERILLISTVHLFYGPWHPLHLAKFGATLDHMSGGRWGLNVVTGFRKDEWAMFGQEQPDHDRRYELAEEYVSLLQRLWAGEDDLDYHSEQWTLNKAFITPKPRYGRPIIVSATSSAAGIAQAVRHADLIFVTSPAGASFDAAINALPGITRQVRDAAAALNRDVRILVNPLIIARDTEAEAWAVYQEIIRQADHGAVDGFFHTHATGDSRSWRGHQRDERIVGGNIQLIGTPEQIAGQIVRLKAIGCDGLQLCFVDYEPELAYFGERILPLLKEAGLRL